MYWSHQSISTVLFCLILTENVISHVLWRCWCLTKPPHFTPQTTLAVSKKTNSWNPLYYYYYWVNLFLQPVKRTFCIYINVCYNNILLIKKIKFVKNLLGTIIHAATVMPKAKEHQGRPLFHKSIIGWMRANFFCCFATK